MRIITRNGIEDREDVDNWPDDSSKEDDEEDPHALNNQCYGVWKEDVKNELAWAGMSSFEITMLDWEAWKEFYNMGLTPHEAVIEEMATRGI